MRPGPPRAVPSSLIGSLHAQNDSDLHPVYIVFVVHSIDVDSPVVPVPSSPTGLVLGQKPQIQVVEDHRLDVRAALRGDCVSAEGEVRRREDARLGIVDVGVVDERQVADTTRDSGVDVVLDAPGLCAVPDP